MIYSTSLVYDGPLQIAFMRIYYESAEKKTRKEKVIHLAHRYFFPLELEALLHYRGFEILRHDGDFEKKPLASESEQQVLICRVLRSRRKK